MTTQRHLNSNKIFGIAVGVILITVAAEMRLVPAGIRDDSGAAYIMIACLLMIGGWIVFKSLFDNKDDGSHTGK